MKIARSKFARLVRYTATPMAMSLDMLRKEGFYAEPVEVTGVRIPGVEHSYSKDVLGFVDILALRRHCVLFVQTTTETNMRARMKKIQRCEGFEACKIAGVLVHVHGWGLGGVKVIDMTARDPDGSWTYQTLINDIVRAGVRSKLTPREQMPLQLEESQK